MSAGRVALLSHVLPPSPSGQSRVLGLVTGGSRVDEVLWLTDDSAALDQAGPPERARLESERHFLLPLPPWPLLRHANKMAGLLPGLRRRAAHIEAILKADKCIALVACTGSVLNPPAAMLAAKRLGLPLVLYLFDDYGAQWPPGIYSRFARLWEPRVAAAAAALIAPNEFLAAEYQRRYGVEPAMVRNPLASDEVAAPAAAALPGDQLKIVYTGAVYDAHFDAFKNLMAALASSALAAKLQVYSEQPPDWLVQHGISGPLEHHGHVAPEEALAAQREADILFLPLGFDTPKDRAVQSSAPGKLAEYLASGRPVLVHAPRDSFLADFFKRRDCGLVVDRPDPDELVRAIGRLAEDAALRKRLVNNARQAASEFSLSAARKAFWSVLDGLATQSGN